MTRPNVHLQKMSAIYEVNGFLSRNTGITTMRSATKAKGRNIVPVKWLSKGKEYPDGLIRLNSINVFKGYIEVPGVDFTESLQPVTLNTQTRILVEMTLYQKEEVWISDICNVEAAFLNTDITVDMFIEWP